MLVGKYLVTLEVGKGSVMSRGRCVWGESLVDSEMSDYRERRSEVIFPDKKEQNDSAIELDGREFGILFLAVARRWLYLFVADNMADSTC